jgi:hypothetical protein
MSHGGFGDSATIQGIWSRLGRGTWLAVSSWMDDGGVATGAAPVRIVRKPAGGER